MKQAQATTIKTTDQQERSDTAVDIPEQHFDASTALAETVVSLPMVDGSVAVILDLSASMASSGERLNHPAALALALTRLLQERVHNVSLLQVGGTTQLTADTVPSPQGATDLAMAMIEAVRTDPQLMLIITDGYENARQGDAAQVAHGIRQLGYAMPLYQVVPQFTAAESLAQRRLGENIPVIPVAHEDGIREILARIVLTSTDENVSDEEMAQLGQLLTAR